MSPGARFAAVHAPRSRCGADAGMIARRSIPRPADPGSVFAAVAPLPRPCSIRQFAGLADDRHPHPRPRCCGSVGLTALALSSRVALCARHLEGPSSQPTARRATRPPRSRPQKPLRWPGPAVALVESKPCGEVRRRPIAPGRPRAGAVADRAAAGSRRGWPAARRRVTRWRRLSRSPIRRKPI